MTSRIKNIIAALAVGVYCLLAVTTSDQIILRFIYLIVLCGVEIIISLLYLFFNRHTLTKKEAKMELIFIGVYTVIAVVIALTRL
jgi:hypothetical protein